MIDCLLRKASPLLSMAEQSDAFKRASIHEKMILHIYMYKVINFESF